MRCCSNRDPEVEDMRLRLLSVWVHRKGSFSYWDGVNANEVSCILSALEAGDFINQQRLIRSERHVRFGSGSPNRTGHPARDWMSFPKRSNLSLIYSENSRICLGSQGYSSI